MSRQRLTPLAMADTAAADMAPVTWASGGWVGLLQNGGLQNLEHTWDNYEITMRCPMFEDMDVEDDMSRFCPNNVSYGGSYFSIGRRLSFVVDNSANFVTATLLPKLVSLLSFCLPSVSVPSPPPWWISFGLLLASPAALSLSPFCLGCRCRICLLTPFVSPASL